MCQEKLLTCRLITSTCRHVYSCSHVCMLNTCNHANTCVDSAHSLKTQKNPPGDIILLDSLKFVPLAHLAYLCRCERLHGRTPTAGWLDKKKKMSTWVRVHESEFMSQCLALQRQHGLVTSLQMYETSRRSFTLVLVFAAAKQESMSSTQHVNILEESAEQAVQQIYTSVLKFPTKEKQCRHGLFVP